jgi:hypothetical protein
MVSKKCAEDCEIKAQIDEIFNRMLCQHHALVEILRLLMSRHCPFDSDIKRMIADFKEHEENEPCQCGKEQ